MQTNILLAEPAHHIAVRGAKFASVLDVFHPMVLAGRIRVDTCVPVANAVPKMANGASFVS
jgi:hypothetical protein